MTLKPHVEMITKQMLPNIRCDNPECTDCSDEVFLEPICHPSAGLGAFVDKKQKFLVLSCKECGKLSAVVAIGDDPRVQ